MGEYIVVTNVWNDELWPAFFSLKRQTVQPKAWFIIDDGSTRQYSGIRYEMAQLWNVPVYYFRTEETKEKGDLMTIGRAWNSILRPLQRYKAEYIATLDADTRVDEDYFEILIDHMELWPFLGAISGKIDGEPRYDHMPSGCAKLVRKNIFDKIDKMWDLASDTFLNIKSLASGHLNTIVDMPIVTRRSTPREGESLGRRLKYCGASWMVALLKSLRAIDIGIMTGYRKQREQTEDPDVRYYYSKRRILKDVFC